MSPDISPNAQRKLVFLKQITLIGIPIALMFIGIYAYMGQWDGVFFGLLLLAIFLASRRAVSKGRGRPNYLISTGVLGITFLVILAAGTGAPYNTFWFFIMPMVYYIFLGIRPASVYLGITTAGLIILLLKPDLFHTHVYDPQLVLRFFIAYALVCLMSFTYESTRKGYEKRLAQQAEQVLKQKELLETLLETLPNPVFFKDTQGRYLGCNPAFEALFSKSRHEIIGRTVHEITPKERADIYLKMDKDLFAKPGKQIYESQVAAQKGTRQVIFYKSTFEDRQGKIQGLVGVIFDITELKAAEAEKSRLIKKLETALAEIKTLSGMLPICSSCKKIRDDQGYWRQLETYIEKHSQAMFSHSICPDCSKTLYGDQPWFKDLEQ